MNAAPLPLGHPDKGWWAYPDLAVVFGLSVHRCKTRMREWEAAGFPAPLPYSRLQKRWRPAPVIAWQGRYEIAAGAVPAPAQAPRFRMIEGGSDR